MLSGSTDSGVEIVGAPKRFRLLSALRIADEVDIVIAFAHQSGWRAIRAALLSSRATIRLVAGTSFLQTEPAVLSDWIAQDFSSIGAKAYLWTAARTFHPKVYVVRGGKHDFALIGSGNLSKGGLDTNIECFYYVQNRRHLMQISDWVRDLVEDKNSCKELSRSVISVYKTRWKEADASRRELRALERDAKQEAAVAGLAEMQGWSRAVRQAKAFFARDKGESWSEHKRAAARIKRLLCYPTFRFPRDNWDEFYRIGELGRLVPIMKDHIYERREKLRRGLVGLLDERVPIQDRVNALCDKSRNDHVLGVGLNLVSKILACTRPAKWPVENDPVRSARKGFGYDAPHGATIGEKYAVFARTMREFRKQTGAKDMLEVDAFFYREWLSNREGQE